MILDGITASAVILRQGQGKGRRTHCNAFKGLFAGHDAKERAECVSGENHLTIAARRLPSALPRFCSCAQGRFV